MGMFDYVKLSEGVKCPGCGRLSTEFQTKDRDCPMLERFTEDQLADAEIDQFYELCAGCGGWIEFNRRTERQPGVGQFRMTFQVKRAPTPNGETDE